MNVYLFILLFCFRGKETKEDRIRKRIYTRHVIDNTWKLNILPARSVHNNTLL